MVGWPYSLGEEARTDNWDVRLVLCLRMNRLVSHLLLYAFLVGDTADQDEPTYVSSAFSRSNVALTVFCILGCRLTHCAVWVFVKLRVALVILSFSPLLEKSSPGVEVTMVVSDTEITDGSMYLDVAKP